MQREQEVSFKTAWNMAHKLHRAMVDPGKTIMCRTVEVDETFYGTSKEGAPVRGTRSNLNSQLI
jgi:hypothetical protein